MRLIDADALDFEFDRRCFSEEDENYVRGVDEAIGVVENAPTVDPVHAAGACYCKECKFWDGYGKCETPDNGLVLEFTKPNDFCSYGERRKDSGEP